MAHEQLKGGMRKWLEEQVHRLERLVGVQKDARAIRDMSDAELLKYWDSFSV